MRIDEAASNGFGDGCPKHERSNEVEEGCPNDCESRRKDARGNHCGNAIGCVMEAVDEVEGKSDQNGDCNQQSAQVHLARPLFIMSLRSKPLLELSCGSEYSALLRAARRVVGL